MRFRTPRDTETAGAAATEADAAEEARVQGWQEERLGQLGYEPEIASRVVRAAWLDVANGRTPHVDGKSWPAYGADRRATAYFDAESRIEHAPLEATRRLTAG